MDCCCHWSILLVQNSTCDGGGSLLAGFESQYCAMEEVANQKIDLHPIRVE